MTVLNKERFNWLQKLIGTDKADEVAADLKQAADTLDAEGVERKAKKPKDGIAVPATGTVGAAKEEEEAPPEEKADGPAIAQRVAEAILSSLRSGGVEISDEALSAALEAAATALSDTEDEDDGMGMGMGMMERAADDAEVLKSRIKSILSGYDDLAEDVAAVAQTQANMHEAVKGLAELVRDLAHQQNEQRKLLSAKPRQSSRAPETELKGDADKLKQLLQEAQKGIDLEFEEVLGIKVPKNRKETK